MAEVRNSKLSTISENSHDVVGGADGKHSGKPIVLSLQRYNKIIINATTTERLQALGEADEEQRNKDLLKAGNEQLVAQFQGNIQRTQEQKLQQIKEQMDKKTEQGIADYEQTKENEAQKRREKIAKAQQIMERLKPGPRELQSAVLQSEVLRARNVQRNINEEFEKAIKKQDFENKKQCEAQAMSWINEEQHRLADRRKSTTAYKQELLRTISDNQQKRSEQKKQMIKEMQAARDATDSETKLQIEKEKAIMEKKREALRKSALEAMKMVEQRRLRDRMVDEVEDRLCCVYNAGKRQMNNLRDEQTKKVAADQQKKIEEQVKKLNSNEEKIEALESERIRRDITTMLLKFTAEEQEKVRKDKAAKQARIEAYLKEMEQQKEAQRRFDEEKRFDMAQRLKNIEINCMFNEAQKMERKRQIQDVRKHLDKQMDDNIRNQMAQKQSNVTCSDDVLDKEHKFFFGYARDLMEDAQQKGRPLYPFVKVIQQYKRDNQIECDRKLPKHLESRVPIGAQKTPSTTTDKIYKEDTNLTRGSVLQNCLKINEIIISEKDKLKNTKYSLQYPFKVQQQDKSGVASSSKPSNDDCASSSSSAKLRYSMQALKKMNQFAAPTCH